MKHFSFKTLALMLCLLGGNAFASKAKPKAKPLTKKQLGKIGSQIDKYLTAEISTNKNELSKEAKFIISDEGAKWIDAQVAMLMSSAPITANKYKDNWNARADEIRHLIDIGKVKGAEQIKKTMGPRVERARRRAGAAAAEAAALGAGAIEWEETPEPIQPEHLERQRRLAEEESYGMRSEQEEAARIAREAQARIAAAAAARAGAGAGAGAPPPYTPHGREEAMARMPLPAEESPRAAAPAALGGAAGAGAGAAARPELPRARSVPVGVGRESDLEKIASQLGEIRQIVAEENAREPIDASKESVEDLRAIIGRRIAAAQDLQQIFSRSSILQQNVNLDNVNKALKDLQDLDYNRAPVLGLQLSRDLLRAIDDASGQGLDIIG